MPSFAGTIGTIDRIATTAHLGEVFGDDYHRACTAPTPVSIRFSRGRRRAAKPRRCAGRDPNRGRAAVPVVVPGGWDQLWANRWAGIVLDFSKYLNRILALIQVRPPCQIEPGVVLDQLNAAAAPHGLQFGPDVATSSRANLGGMIGNNSAGARSIRHGKTVDHVLSVGRAGRRRRRGDLVR